MIVRTEEAMRVAPDGHVIDLKAGEEVTGVLAQYLVTSRCNVTVVKADPGTPESDGGENSGGSEEPEGDPAEGSLSASLTATADVLHEVLPESEADPEAETPPVKVTKPRRAVAK